MLLKIYAATTREQRDACYRLRHEVFVEEQGVPVELEIDEHDEMDAIHFLGEVNGTSAAAARIVVKQETAKIGRLVVSKPHRGGGHGVAMMRFVLDHVRDEGLATEVALDAQIQATGFYEALGFAIEGEEFMDAGIPHVRMVRTV